MDDGITLFDTADIYGESEDFLGKLLRGNRDNLVIATKFGNPLHGPTGRRAAAAATSAARSRRRCAGCAPTTSTSTSCTSLTGVRRSTRRFPRSTSSCMRARCATSASPTSTAWQVADADWTARTRGLTRFISVQNNYNLLERDVEAEVAPACKRFGLGILPYFPLASGLLTGKYRRGEPPPQGTRLVARPEALTDRTLDVVEKLEKYAAERGRTLLDVAIGGLAAQPAVASVIAGATKPEQVRANVAAGGWVPTKEDLAALDEVAPTPRHR